jgi:hypothetical protein
MRRSSADIMTYLSWLPLPCGIPMTPRSLLMTPTWRPERPHTSRRRGLFIPAATQHFTMLARNLLHMDVTPGL